AAQGESARPASSPQLRGVKGEEDRMPAAIALIVADSRHSRFGQPAQLDDRLGDATVLEHTLRRAARVSRVEQIVLVHPADQPPPALPTDLPASKPITAFPVPSHLYSPLDQHWVAAR